MINNVFILKKSKKELFINIYEKHFDFIYAFVFSRLAGNQDAVDDIVQETFFAAMKSLDNFKNNSSYRTWLCGIAKHKILNYYQRDLVKNDFTYLDQIEHDTQDYSVDFYLLNSEKRKVVLDVLNKLCPSYRYALILKYIDEHSVKEISVMLNKTPKAIDGILQRARAEFIKEYSKYAGGASYELRGNEN